MTRISRGAVVLTGALAIAPLSAQEAWSGPGKSRAESHRAPMTEPAGGREHASGVIETRAQTTRAREVLKILVDGLKPGRRYQVLIDDPSTADPAPQPVGDVRAARGRRLRMRLDSASGSLPQSLDELAGARVEIRDMRGALVLAGQVPRSSELPTKEFRVVETEVFADTFDAETPGAAPSAWSVAGATVTVDAAVADGGAGNSALIADADALSAPEMARTFTAQGGQFAAEFVLIAGSAAGRTTATLAQTTDTGPVFPSGLGTGLGFYEDGTIGFAVGDSIGTYAAGATHRFRVDVDLATRTFDVTLDGTVVVTDRALGFDGAALDRIAFGGALETTGTANVDTVRVASLATDFSPVADAGPDRVVVCTGAQTLVTLDGTLSADPEGAALTYRWTGDFVEGTAEGPTPTVTFTTPGVHTVSLVVNDGFFDSPADTAVIELIGVPVEITVTGLPTTLWPPNHNMVRVEPVVTVIDSCGLVMAAPDVHLVVTSNEADDGKGDGSTTDDAFVRTAADFDLRAERAGGGDGRTYHLVWTVAVPDGEPLVFEADVTVPHDQGNGNGRGRGRR